VSSERRLLAENIAALFGKVHKDQRDPDFGGIEDKVLSDVCGCIETMIQAHYGDTLDAARERISELVVMCDKMERERDALRVECEAWREADELPRSWPSDSITQKAIERARRLRAQNEKEGLRG
jgi:hypothetical protein